MNSFTPLIPGVLRKKIFGGLLLWIISSAITYRWSVFFVLIKLRRAMLSTPTGRNCSFKCRDVSVMSVSVSILLL